MDFLGLDMCMIFEVLYLHDSGGYRKTFPALLGNPTLASTLLHTSCHDPKCPVQIRLYNNVGISAYTCATNDIDKDWDFIDLI